MQAYVDYDGCSMEFLARAAGRPGGRTVRQVRQRPGPADVDARSTATWSTRRSSSCGATCGRSSRASSGSPTRCRASRAGSTRRTSSAWRCASTATRAGDATSSGAGRWTAGSIASWSSARRRPSATAGIRCRGPSGSRRCHRSAGRASSTASRARSRASSTCRSSTACVPPPTPSRRKAMLNSVRQLANAHRTLALDGRWPSRPGPVLLVDDLVDSGWTLTVAGWLLREGGSGPVHPFAWRRHRGEWNSCHGGRR